MSNDLLDLSKLDAGKMGVETAEIDLGYLVRLTGTQFEALAHERRISFTVDAVEGCILRVDVRKLERVLINLLANAFKFTPNGGLVRCIFTTPDETVARIEVSDTGPGVRPELREKIFERFSQGDEQAGGRFGGTGLGLAIARDFVTLHGGSIHVEDAPGGGAMFIIDLPRQTAADPLNGPNWPILEGVTSGVTAYLGQPEPSVAVDTAILGLAEKPLILIVEDNADLRRFLADALASEWRVAMAAEGRQGLARALELQPDLILSDLMMPGMQGDQMIAELRTQRELDNVPVLVLSARGDEKLRTHLLTEQAQDYLVKPFSTEELRARIRNLVKMKRAGDILRTELASGQRDVALLAHQIAVKNRELQIAIDGMRVARDEAVRASETRSTLLGMLSHELRTPLTGIDLHLTLLKHERTGPLTDRQRIALDNLSEALARLRARIEALLDFSQLANGMLVIAPNSFNMSVLVNEIVEDQRGKAEEKGLELALSGTDVPHWLTSDPALVRLIAVNLIDNAIKFTHVGRVTVSLGRRDDRLMLDVADTGPGIPLERQATIFEPFEQLEDLRHKHTPGIGLGLAIIRQLLNRLGGTVSLESAPGLGSSFSVILPSIELTEDQ